jgi:hypothetical protein
MANINRNIIDAAKVKHVRWTDADISIFLSYSGHSPVLYRAMSKWHRHRRDRKTLWNINIYLPMRLYGVKICSENYLQWHPLQNNHLEFRPGLRFAAVADHMELKQYCMISETWNLWSVWCICNLKSDSNKMLYTSNMTRRSRNPRLRP